MEVEPNLPTHTVYRPRDLAAAPKLPIIVWGNGGCANFGNRFRYFLTEIASHGYVAIAIGPIGPSYLEGNTSQVPPGTAPPPARGPGDVLPPPETRSGQLIDAINWALAENDRPGSPFQHKLDTDRIAVMGQSCGGLQAIVASADPRVKTSVIWNSGVLPDGQRNMPGAEGTKAGLAQLHAPVAYISGDSSDIAYANANDDFERITSIPALRAYEKGVGHMGTYRLPNGGEFAAVGVAWLDWQLKGSATAARWFVGPDCRLCTDPNWVVRKKNIS
jgi:dienelactone hydrolase